MPADAASPRSTRRGTTALLGLALLIYGRHLGDGYLADDFVYRTWLQEGLPELLRRMTTASNPQMIRPLPAFAWLLSALPAGAAWQHGLSILLHGLCGVLVARLAATDHTPTGVPLLAGALFVAFPLLAEPVIWLSAGPDLFATASALLALWLASRDPRTAVASWASVLLFAAALLSKESVLLLPVVLLLIAGRRRMREAVTWATVAAVYLAARWAIFGGPGGYLDADGGAYALQGDPALFLRNLGLQLPFRTLVPLKRAAGLAVPLGAASTLLIAIVVMRLGAWRRPRVLVGAALGFVVALLPVAAFFSIDVDHENARLLYFPLAVGLAMAARAATFDGPRWRTPALLLLALWSVVAFVNAGAWSQGSREVTTTLRTLARIENRFPAGATVAVDGNDTWHGAYVWRNGFAAAVRQAGLRTDLRWSLGPAARLDPRDTLGTRAFAIEVLPNGGWRDWTECERTLRATRRGSGDDLTQTSAGRWLETPAPSNDESTIGAIAVLAQAGGRAVDGRLWWRRPGHGSFNATDSRGFRLHEGQTRVVVRLPPGPSTQSPIALRITASDLDALHRIERLDRPAACGAVNP